MQTINLTISPNSEIIRSVYERNEISNVIFETKKEVKSILAYKEFADSMGMDEKLLSVHISKKKRLLSEQLSEIFDQVVKYSELWMDEYVRLCEKVKSL